METILVFRKKNNLPQNLKNKLYIISQLQNNYLFLHIAWVCVDTTDKSPHLVFAMVQEPYIQRSLKKGPFDLATRDMDSELRYGLGNVLGTQP